MSRIRIIDVLSHERILLLRCCIMCRDIYGKLCLSYGKDGNSIVESEQEVSCLDRKGISDDGWFRRFRLLEVQNCR